MVPLILMILFTACVASAILQNDTINEIITGDLRHSFLSPRHRDLNAVTPTEVRIRSFLRQTIPEDCPIVCPPNTVQVKEGYCYRYIQTPLNWHDAKKDCEEQGGYLAKPELDYSETAAELSAIYRDIIGKVHIWIGATDMDSTIVWKWLSGEILSHVHPSWVSGHPGNYGIENCAQINQMKRGNLQIRKERCIVARNFLCQFDVLNGPNPYTSTVSTLSTT